jgi:N-glycosylase/DNA lyase
MPLTLKIRTPNMWNPSVKIDPMVAELNKLLNNPELKALIDKRVNDFKEMNVRESQAWFEELSYCLLTAYSSARMGQICVNALCDCGVLFEGTVDKVAETLRCQGHRFANKRAEYIVEARRLSSILKKKVEGFKSSRVARKWLVENIKGLGWKEASHFLRNVGYLDLAIIDRHILSNMIEFGLIHNDGKKGLTKKKYLEYEHILGVVASKIGLTLGEMDLYLWYRKTGEVLK